MITMSDGVLNLARKLKYDSWIYIGRESQHMQRGDKWGKKMYTCFGSTCPL